MDSRLVGSGILLEPGDEVPLTVPGGKWELVVCGHEEGSMVLSLILGRLYARSLWLAKGSGRLRGGGGTWDT